MLLMLLCYKMLQEPEDLPLFRMWRRTSEKNTVEVGEKSSMKIEIWKTILKKKKKLLGMGMWISVCSWEADQN